MTEETIFKNPHKRMFLIAGKTGDWYIGRDLAKLNFESFLVEYLKEIGYDHIMLYGGAEFRGKYVLDEESSRFVFEKENKKSGVIQPKEAFECEGENKKSRRTLADRRKKNRNSSREQSEENRNAQMQPTGWENLVYGKEHISEQIFVGQFKEFMEDTKHDHAFIFSDLDAFFNSRYYDTYMRMFKGWIDNASRSRNIVIFIAKNDSLRQLESSKLVHHPEFASLFCGIGKDTEGGGISLKFYDSHVLELALPGNDEFVRLLEQLRIAGIDQKEKTRSVRRGREETETHKRLYLDYPVQDVEKIASALRFCSYEEQSGSGPAKEECEKMPINDVWNKLGDFMKKQKDTKEGRVPFSAEEVYRMYGKKDGGQKSALEELNKEGWEAVYKVLCDVINDNKKQMEELEKQYGREEDSEEQIHICQRMISGKSGKRAVSIPHFTLTGPPGVGKTTIAKQTGRVLNEAGILSTGQTVVVRGAELISGHVGGTAHLVADAVERAKNGVLFIDEAYGLVNSTQGEGHGRDFAQAAVDTLVAYCGEEQQDEFPFCLILAGYPDELEPIFRMNDGLRRRMTYSLEIEPYSDELLSRIYLNYIDEQGYTIEEELKKEMPGFFHGLKQSVRVRQFGNAGTAVQEIGRELTIRNCNVRDSQMAGTDGYCEKHIVKEDFGEKQKYFRLSGDKEREAVKMEEKIQEILDSRVGNEELKNQIQELFNSVQHNLRYPKRQEPVNPGYYFFVGDPGTGKSTAAETLAKCLYEMDLVNSPELIRDSAGNLVSGYVGQTSSKTAGELERSFKRVLLIDEAYALHSGSSFGGADYNEQAMTEIVAFLDQEENRQSCCIIFAGYEKDMRALTVSETGNSGLLSRISHVIHFAPYTGKQCAEILRKFAENNGACSYTLQPGIQAYYETVFEALRTHPRFANGRTVRMVFERMAKKAKARVLHGHYPEDDERLSVMTMEDVLTEEEIREFLEAMDEKYPYLSA